MELSKYVFRGAAYLFVGYQLSAQISLSNEGSGDN
jgi:hypothetical protein